MWGILARMATLMGDARGDDQEHGRIDFSAFSLRAGQCTSQMCSLRITLKFHFVYACIQTRVLPRHNESM